MKCTIYKKLIWIFFKVLETIDVQLCTFHHELYLWNLILDGAKGIPHVLVGLFGHDVLFVVDGLVFYIELVGNKTLIMLHHNMINFLTLSNLLKDHIRVIIQSSILHPIILFKNELRIKPMINQNSYFLLFFNWWQNWKIISTQAVNCTFKWTDGGLSNQAAFLLFLHFFSVLKSLNIIENSNSNQF